MSKIWKAFQSRLIWYLLGCVVIAGMVAFGCGYLFIDFGQDFIESRYDDPEVNKTFQNKYMEDLQEYVTDNGIMPSTMSGLKSWVNENSYVYLALYQNNKVIFNSDYLYDDIDTEEDLENEEVELLGAENLYQLKLADGTIASADMFCYDYWRYDYYVWMIGVAFGIAIFLILFTGMLQWKFKYINDIEKELQILEGGNLEYPITIKGEDELGNLARGIEQMRLSIIENMKKERLMLQANKDLVTSMSHDLRTPLTTLTGYLEILNMNNVKDEERKKHYLELSLAKTREIKELSDELFEYFLIYGEDNRKLMVEKVPAHILVEDLIENQFLGLEEDGYELQSENSIQTDSGNCLINVKYMQRVLNNIVSNLEKYADKDRPVEILAAKERNFLVIQVCNRIRKNLEAHESTKIGLVTCERIMKLHHGEFQKYEEEDKFTVKLIIPME